MDDLPGMVARIKQIVAELDAAAEIANGASRTQILIGLCHLQMALDTLDRDATV